MDSVEKLRAIIIATMNNEGISQSEIARRGNVNKMLISRILRGRSLSVKNRDKLFAVFCRDN